MFNKILLVLLLIFEISRISKYRAIIFELRIISDLQPNSFLRNNCPSLTSRRNRVHISLTDLHKMVINNYYFGCQRKYSTEYRASYYNPSTSLYFQLSSKKLIPPCISASSYEYLSSVVWVDERTG